MRTSHIIDSPLQEKNGIITIQKAFSVFHCQISTDFFTFNLLNQLIERLFVILIIQPVRPLFHVAASFQPSPLHQPVTIHVATTVIEFKGLLIHVHFLLGRKGTLTIQKINHHRQHVVIIQIAVLSFLQQHGIGTRLCTGQGFHIVQHMAEMFIYQLVKILARFFVIIGDGSPLHLLICRSQHSMRHTLLDGVFPVRPRLLQLGNIVLKRVGVFVGLLFHTHQFRLHFRSEIRLLGKDVQKTQGKETRKKSHG